MRPLSLTLRGFRSYATEHSFGFTGRRLVGVVGPIGSGKSSLLDAISFALYGRTPTVQRDTKSLINQRLDSAHVELWFEVDGQVWRAVRALRRKGQSAHRLTRHPSLDPESERLEEINQERAVTERVEALLGLDFHAFGRSVLLAQNQFARFLEATGGERDQVLKGVFGLDRVEDMQDRAKAHRDAAARDLEELQRRRAEAETDRKALVEARGAFGDQEKATALLEEAEPAMKGFDQALAEASAAESGARNQIESLQALEARLPFLKEEKALFKKATEQAKLVEKKKTALAGAEQQRAAADEELARVIARNGDRQKLAELQAKVQQFDQLTVDRQRAEKALAATTTVHGKAAAGAEAKAVERDSALATVAEAERALGGVKEARLEAESALHQAEHGAMAATLRAGLTVGEACPVCRQPVADLTEMEGAPDVTAANARLEACRSEERTAIEAVAAAARRSAAAGEEVAAAVTRVEQAAAEVRARGEEADEIGKKWSGLAAELMGILGDGEPRDRLAVRLSAVAVAEQAREMVQADVEQASKALAGAIEGSEGVRAELQRLSTIVAAVSALLDAAIEVAAEPGPLQEALSLLRERLEAAKAAAEDAAKEAARAREATRAERNKELELLGLALTADFAAMLQAARSARAAAESRVALLEERVARVTELEAENSATLARHAVFSHLAADLAPSRFLSYLLDEERAALADLAGARFELLSGGRYRFSPDGGFDVVDLSAAEAVRKPGSLSGGETFLGSLALALALAEMVTREGGRLDAFLLDEGFGTLDVEHLDLAMDGVERLAADGEDRLVLVVSHVPALRERLEDLIELGKDPITGDTRVVGGSSGATARVDQG